MKLAIINNITNLVENIILVDNLSDWQIPIGYRGINVDNVPVGIGYIYNGSSFIVPVPTTGPNEKLKQNTNQAKSLLVASDVTICRITESVALGKTLWTAGDVVAWLNYRQDLRTIITNLGVGTIPAQPAYPANT